MRMNDHRRIPIQPNLTAHLILVLLFLLPGCLGTVESPDLTVTFFDVGQGDSALLQVDGRAMLIDAGPYDAGPGIVRWLDDHDIRYLDVIVATHPHSDHIGGMSYILKNLKTGMFIDNGDTHTTPTYETLLRTLEKQNIPYQSVQEGDKIDLSPQIRIRVLNPPDKRGNDLNDNSLVLEITAGSQVFLMMGDAGISTETRLLSKGILSPVDLLKVGHHGSRHSSGREFINTVSPEIAIISLAADNEYGYPQKNPVRYLTEVGAGIYRTDQVGTITISSDQGKLRITTEKPSNP